MSDTDDALVGAPPSAIWLERTLRCGRAEWLSPSPSGGACASAIGGDPRRAHRSGGSGAVARTGRGGVERGGAPARFGPPAVKDGGLPEQGPAGFCGGGALRSPQAGQ